MFASAIALAGGCSDEAQEEQQVHAVAPPPALHESKHLEVAQGPSPAQWLASREAGRDLSEQDPLVLAYARMLETASRRFREYPRMIANRAVQMEEMLAEKNKPEPARLIIEGLSAIPGETRYVDSFGSVCQQYFNLRLQGHDRQEALELLKARADATN